MATKVTCVIPATNSYNYGIPTREVKGQSRATPEVKKKRHGVDGIRVCIRKRPLGEREGKADLDVVQTDPHRSQVLVKEEKLALDLSKATALHKFRFDEVFPEGIGNKAVYERTVKSLIPFVIQGGRATCFAFGQTGSGKTHTLLGDSTDRGLYQYASEELFDLLRPNPDGLFVWISYFEIYCGKIYDLLNKRERIKALENDRSEVCITGANEVPVSSPYILSKFIEQGNNVRSQGSSGVNSMSSRSHAVLQIQLKDVTGNKLGRLTIIDLAGSERACDRGDPDRATRLEGAEINTSLLSLKECIRALDQEHPHKPFRQSKLTQILRDSLIGGAKTCMIACISPGNSAIEDTLNTLKYAGRVKEIHRKASDPPTPSSYTPKGFSPHNTSTPMKGQKGGTPAPTPVRGHRVVDRSGRRKSRDGPKGVDSSNARGDEIGRNLRAEGSKTPRKVIKSNSGRGDSFDHSSTAEGGQNGCDDEKENRNGVSRPRGVLEGISSPIRREIVQDRDEMISRTRGGFPGGGTRRSDCGRQKAVNENGQGLEKDTCSPRDHQATERDGRAQLDRRSEAVRRFLSHSLPIWEDEAVQEDRIFAPSLSFAWEVDNPHYVMREGAEREGGSQSQLSAEGSKRRGQRGDQTGSKKQSYVCGLGGRADGDNSGAQKHSRSWNRLDQEEQGPMRFENRRYFEKHPKIRNGHARAVGEFGYGDCGGELSVKQETRQHSASQSGQKESLMHKGVVGERDSLGLERNKDNRSPSGILTDNTLELLAEVDKCMLTMSLSNHLKAHSHHGAAADSWRRGGHGYSSRTGVTAGEREPATEGSKPPDGEHALTDQTEGRRVTGGPGEQDVLDGCNKAIDAADSALEQGNHENGMRAGDSNRTERKPEQDEMLTSVREVTTAGLDDESYQRGGNRVDQNWCEEGTTLRGDGNRSFRSSFDGGSTPRRSAFFRETLQPVTREWHLVEDNGSSPVLRSKMGNSLDNSQVCTERVNGRVAIAVSGGIGRPEGRRPLEADMPDLSKEVTRERGNTQTMTDSGGSPRLEDQEHSGKGDSPLDLRVTRNRKVREESDLQMARGISGSYTELNGKKEGRKISQESTGGVVSPVTGMGAPAHSNGGLVSVGGRVRPDTRDGLADERDTTPGRESGGDVSEQRTTHQGREMGVPSPETVDLRIGGGDGRGVERKDVESPNQAAGGQGKVGEVTAGLEMGANFDKIGDTSPRSGFRTNGMVTPDDLKFGRLPQARSRGPRSGSCVSSDRSGLEGSLGLLSPLLEQRSDDGQWGGGETHHRDRGLDERFERSPSPPGRPNSALERSTGTTGLTTTMPNKTPNTRELILSSHQECLKEIQQLCDSGWEIINRLDQGQVDIAEYVAEAASAVERQQKCIETFKDQLAVYNAYVEQDERTCHIPVRDTVTRS